MTQYFDQLAKILGQNSQSDDFRQVVSLLGEQPVLNQPIPSSRYYQFFRSGVIVACNPNLDAINAIWLMGRANHGFATYEGDLPKGASFQFHKIDVRRLFGKPLRSMTSDKLVWDLYKVSPYELHFQYDHKTQDQLTLVTLQLPGDHWQLVW